MLEMRTHKTEFIKIRLETQNQCWSAVATSIHSTFAFLMMLVDENDVSFHRKTAAHCKPI
jgi:hypothetical protein